MIGRFDDDDESANSSPKGKKVSIILQVNVEFYSIGPGMVP